MSEPGISTLLDELGELGRVIGLLYQKVEASEQTASDGDRRIQEKLDTWIQANGAILRTNQELMTLIVSNSQELQKSTNAYDECTSLWDSLQQQLTAFEQQMSDWNDGSAAQAAQAAPAEVSPETSELLSQFSESCQALTQRLDQLDQARTKPESGDGSQTESAIRRAKRAVERVLRSPASLRDIAVVGLLLSGLALLGIQRLKPEYRVETPRPLSLDEAALLNWAQSPEGQQAHQMMRWNSGLLDDRSCEREVKRLGVTLELQGKSASSGFCTLWVVPPEKRQFEAGS